ncbi:hypothetical protein EJ03DRAFT_300603 [Teratosphaeria nubilosa]|uniref:Zn(2)-C6 fungal-type domain-containing protein n=1 Tax=Teratosphaeria nubilosa TaxID=161662 RepID=A0A6G1KX51_9PEZI|nr:hypothetical protein EJ03DRAFT_300603 [Teratosphaeria nubilosa]
MENVEPSLQHTGFPEQQQQHTQQFASLACASCRKQKRKCDKQLPTCGLCQRIGRICDYTDENRAPVPSPEEFSQLRQEVAELKNLLHDIRPSGSNAGFACSNGSMSNEISPANSILSPAGHQPAWPGLNSFPALFFLDSNAFEYERFQIQAPYVRVPPGALSALGDSTELRLMIEQYFSSVHTYFPIVSKIRLYQHLSNPLHEPGADIALLFLAMKLASSEIPEGLAPLTQLYQDVKSFASYVEASNGLNIQLVQALLLICLYETGHGIYPAAYLSAGHAGRLGHAMGLHDLSAPQILQRCTTWTEQEERRRVWWGVVLMDRFVSIGNRAKPFATSDPSLDTHLPTEDAAWDRGQILVAAPLALSASTTIHAAPFARTCQACHLLGKVIRHKNDTNLPVDYKFEEALQLNRTLRALACILPSESEEDDPTQRPTLCTSMAMTYSALLELYEAYPYTEHAVPNGPETQLQMQQEAIAGISDITTQVLYLARRLRDFISRAGIGRLSPFTLDALYQGAANFACYARESSDPTCGERLLEMKEVLLLCEKRWKVAGEYRSIVESTEFALSSAIR